MIDPINKDDDVSSEPTDDSAGTSREVARMLFSDADFSSEELECLYKLYEICRESQLDVSNQTIYRFAIFHGFNVRRARAAIFKKHKHPYLNFRLEDDLFQFIKTSMLIFPIPGLKSLLGADVFYFRPSRYEPSASSNKRLIVENLCYVFNDMSQTVGQCRNGIMEIINLEGYSMKNFHIETLKDMIRVDEGQILPTRLAQTLIINAPKAFEIVWGIANPFMSGIHKKRFQVITEKEQLKDYLMDGYETYLPDELLPKSVKPTAKIIGDWIDPRNVDGGVINPNDEV